MVYLLGSDRSTHFDLVLRLRTKCGGSVTGVWYVSRRKDRLTCQRKSGVLERRKKYPRCLCHRARLYSTARGSQLINLIATSEESSTTIGGTVLHA
jgi:hypothetical protein